MSLLRTSMLNAIVVAVRAATALVLNKLLAIYVGPAGYAVVGQFQNAISVVTSLAGGGLSTGVTKGTAEHFDDSSEQKAIYRTAVRLALITSVVVGVFLFATRNALSILLLHDRSVSSVFVWLALSLPAVAANNLLIAIANGKKDVSVYVVSNIAGSLIVLLVGTILTRFFNLTGALTAFALSPAVTVLVTLAVIRRRHWFRFRELWGRMERRQLKQLSAFALMGVISALAMPTALILIRELVTNTLGADNAGYWQACWRISDLYLMLITTTLTVYYLPRIAETRTAPEMRKEIFKVYRFVLPVVAVSAVMVYLARDVIVTTVFTPEFSPMRDLFAWQLLGDFVKIAGWVLSYVALGRAMIRAYVVTEIVFCAVFYLFTIAFVSYFGLQGVAMAYFMAYALYWIVMFVLVKAELSRMPQRVSIAVKAEEQ